MPTDVRRPLRIGIVAGEASGDQLGAGLIKAVLARHPDAQFEGIAGPLMTAAGCRAIFPTERLAVMGLVEVLGRLPELFRIRAELLRRFSSDPPDLFIGIDAPDFNIPLERRLKRAGVTTAHYVSPSVWAWRQERVKTIAESVDLMLTLFPFEARFYEEQGVPVRFVGHPLADHIPDTVDRAAARQRLGLPAEGQVVALLPGSRGGEVKRLAGLFIQAAAWCAARYPGLRFIAPMATPAVRASFEEILTGLAPDLPVTVVDGGARNAMAAADVVLAASGTVTLEAMLLRRPMVVAYRLAALTYWIVKTFRLVKIRYFALPNLLSGEPLVPEFIQGQATPQALGGAVLQYLEHPDEAARLAQAFDGIRRTLQRDADTQAAEAVLALIDAKQTP